jgi:hypothetical protein
MVLRRALRDLGPLSGRAPAGEDNDTWISQGVFAMFSAIGSGAMFFALVGKQRNRASPRRQMLIILSLLDLIWSSIYMVQGFANTYNPNDDDDAVAFYTPTSRAASLIANSAYAASLFWTCSMVSTCRDRFGTFPL